MGGDREGRLLVSSRSTDKDLLMVGFHTIPPITFLQYWLFRDLKNQMQRYFAHRHVQQESKRGIHERQSAKAPSLKALTDLAPSDTSPGHTS